VTFTEGRCQGEIGSSEKTRTSPEARKKAANKKTAVKAPTKAAKKGTPVSSQVHNRKLISIVAVAATGFQFNDVMNLVAPFAGRGKAGDDHPDHAVLNWNRITDFEFRFVGAPSEGLACRFLHLSSVAHRRFDMGGLGSSHPPAANDAGCRCALARAAA
jgi:hypothetical protein